MPVLTTPRRITLYWLLLLLPTLAVGVGALLLLRREQQRVAERGAYADEARRAAIAARARLIVENVELLVGDVQNGLLDALAAEPPAGLDAFLERLEKTNPLVRTTFRATADGRLLRPDARTASEDTRGFLRRFARQFGPRPPWSMSPLAQSLAAEKREQDRVFDEATVRQSVNQNVVQAQSARRDVQELFKNSYALSNAAPAAPAAPGGLVDRATSSDARARGSGTEGERPAAAPAAERPTQASSASWGGSRAERKASELAAAPPPRAKDAAPDRRGWVPARVDGRLHLFGWLQPGGAGEVRGVELEVAALISRLAGTLPAEVNGAEGYALRDDQARVLHQAGAIPRGIEPAIRVPLAASLLPGWDVVAYVLPASPGAENGIGFFRVSALLVAIFVAAILAGGWLLRWQARRSEEAAAQKTSFVANVSHEFKTPLTTIRLYSELLEQGRVRDAAQGTAYLRTIGRETQRLARLVNNALDFSRLEQGRKKYARETFDLTAELSRLLETHEPRVAEAGLSLKRELPVAPLRVTTDRDALEQIVLNLIDNACKYAVEGGEVTVALAPLAARAAGSTSSPHAESGPAGGAEVRVSDRGPGVPAEQRERIFEKFHRVNEALTAEKSGAGLGLSIARQLARGLGGELRHVPRAGGGAEFVLELP